MNSFIALLTILGSNCLPATYYHGLGVPGKDVAYWLKELDKLPAQAEACVGKNDLALITSGTLFFH